jgi:2-polyprenyl-3-methyl-5-hydroxy-6-metoxy-1,4-benzoquinol methylase
VCGLIVVAEAHWLPRAEEKARYDLHQNSPEDEGYRAFLGRLVAPLGDRLAPGSRGLDFGCGPGPTLSVMLEEMGHSVALYDPFYKPDRDVLEGVYDFVTATEVFEHLRRPRQEAELLWSLLRPGGLLGIMTRLVPDDVDFATWRYKDDDTHIAFYARRTFEWLAAKLKARVDILEPDVVLLHKPR